MPLRNLIIIFLSATISLLCYLRGERNRYATNVAEAMDLIQENFVEHVEYRDLYENAMKGLTEGLDPYSDYISPKNYKYFKEGLDQEFGGIGIMVEYDPETKRLTVMSPLVDTPAARAGIRAGDTILAIDGQDTLGMSLKESVELIRGKRGEKIVLTIVHRGDQEPIDVQMSRAIIPMESVLGYRRIKDGSWDFQLPQERRITYIQILTFGDNTAEEVQQTLEENRPEAIILDLRDNPGGLLTAAVEISDMFVHAGTIVSIRGRDGAERETYRAEPGTSVSDSVPIVVLVNRFSASASEIIAACLQDHERATIIGNRTWGKGTVQKVIELEGGKAALKLTSASYWRPSGRNIHRHKDDKEEDDWGVTPDEGFQIVLTEEQIELVLEERKLHDAFRNGGDSEEPPSDKNEVQPTADGQLQRAVEFLRQYLDRDKLTRLDNAG